MKSRCFRRLVVLLTLLAACGGDDISIRGKLARSSTAAVKGTAMAVDVSQADEIWALPIGGVSVDHFSFTSRQVVPVESDGSFEFIPEATSYNYVLALVNSSKCGSPGARAGWTDADIDDRLACIVGVVSIPDALDANALSAVPVSQQSCSVDLRSVQSGSSEAKSSTTMGDAADCLTGDLESLEAIAKADNALLGIGNYFANNDYDGGTNDGYVLNLNYSWDANNGLSSTLGQYGSAADLDFAGYQFYFATTVDVASFADEAVATPGYLKLTPPADVSSSDGMINFGPSSPLVSNGPWDISGNRYSDPSGLGFQVNPTDIFGGVAASFTGVTANGEWRFERGSQIARSNLALVAPFADGGNGPDVSKPRLIVPVPKINMSGTNVDSVEMKFVYLDGTQTSEVPYEVAIAFIQDVGLYLNNADGSCIDMSPNQHGTMTSSFSWTPSRTHTIGGSGGCEVVTVGTTYSVNGTTFGFAWDAPGF